MNTVNKYRIEYFFNHSTHGFSNSVTVMAIDGTEATKKAKFEASEVYGSKMLKRFSFKQPVLIN